MNVIELIERLQNAVTHGQDPKAEVQAWDPDMEDWQPITVLSLDKRRVRIYTDEP